MTATCRAIPLLALALVLVALPAAGQELEGCDDFMRYVDREDYQRALDELNWCKRSIEDLHFEKIKEIMDRTINGYAPEDITIEGALGFATIQAVYSNGDDEIEFSITTGSAAGSAATAGLSALSGLASSLGVRSRDSDQVRVAGLTGQMKEESRGVSLMLPMEGGVVMNIEGPDAETVEAFAEEIIPDLEDYLG